MDFPFFHPAAGIDQTALKVCSECREPLQLHVPHKEVPTDDFRCVMAMAHIAENPRGRNRSTTKVAFFTFLNHVFFLQISWMV